MSSFKFNFSGVNNTEQQQNSVKEEIAWLQCEEVKPYTQLKHFDDIVVHAKMFTCGNVEIGHVVAKEIVQNMEKNCLMNTRQLAESEHSDLVTGIYEGGLKLWECTTDLIEYMVQNTSLPILKDTSVLDLGCGTGIAGIYAFINDAFVTFQDYNKEVLEYVTIPNVLLNIEDEERETKIKKCKFYSGDWSSFNRTLPESEVYDLILTSETIYNPSNYDKLIDIFNKRLSKNGSVFLAAKTYYFGVGGGTRQFEADIKKNGLLKSEVCWKSSGGIQREILRITINS